MTPAISRRLLLKAGTLGLGALAVPGGAQLLARTGFTHNVASGEPGHYKVLLWTRYVPAAGASRRLRWEVAEDEGFRRVRAGGTVSAEPNRDHIVKPVAEGLRPGTRYFYRFTDSRGASSPVGRTRTLPNGRVARFGMGVFSCSNLPFGHFNAYGHAADRDDLDLMVHLGDYIYEYPRGNYPSEAQALAGRLIESAGETLALADYRLRYAAYRSDPDLQRLHQMHPMIAMWDDHESANDAWKDGAENHGAGEGDWAAREAAAVQAYREWMPVSDADYTQYRIGDLAMIFRPETRLTARTQPLDLAAALRGQADLPAALTAFRDGPWRNPARTILGAEQERWLADGFRNTARDGVKWQVLAQQVLMGSLRTPEALSAGLASAPEAIRNRAMVSIAAGRVGLPFNFDMWDGYPAARERLLRSALDADANLVVLSGDSHNAWAFNLDVGGTPAGVDLGVQSVTSPGYEGYLPQVPPQMLAGALRQSNPQLAWANTSQRGYMSVTLTPERATSEWHFLNTIRERSTALAGTHRMTVAHGARRLAQA